MKNHIYNLKLFAFCLILILFISCTANQSEKPNSNTLQKSQAGTKDKMFLLGMGMLRLNWASVEGNEIRFRYSDMGLPADFSTRERASFMLDGTLGSGKYQVNGHLNYDPENRITQPPLDFLVQIKRNESYLAFGDYRQGVFNDSVFSRYFHPFRGGVMSLSSKRTGVKILGGLARGEAGIEELSALSGSGPYYLSQNPVIRGSEMIFLVVKSRTNPNLELKRTPLARNSDYFIDYDRGAIIFNYPLYPTDQSGNQISLIVNYQFESLIGQFTNTVLGFSAFIYPTQKLKLDLTYIAEAEKSTALTDLFSDHRGILSLGMNVDTKPVTAFGELSFSSEPNSEQQQGYFGGAIFRLSKDLRFYVNAWQIDTEFPVFANKQLQYGYSLLQIFPSYSDRNIFLSPFQFSRNLGTELYPFTLSRLSINEQEFQGFLEWDQEGFRVSTGYGMQKEISSELTNKNFYLSTYKESEKNKVWGKLGLGKTQDQTQLNISQNDFEILAGVRQQIKKTSHGEIFFQVDYQKNYFNNLIEDFSDTNHTSLSVFSEYLTTGRDGFFAGYRKETLYDKETGGYTLDSDIFEVGVRNKIYKGFFIDSRFRFERDNTSETDKNDTILSLGAGLENKKFRAMGRYEIQINKNDLEENRRSLYSFFLFGNPFKRMSLSLRYYKQKGKTDTFISLTERSEEQLNFRLLWRPVESLSLYSQWRYDTNLELYPPLDKTRSNSLASVQGLKYRISKKLEFLANYKLLRITGPLKNHKETLAAELGYLFIKHFRLGIGTEFINFKDNDNADVNYKTTVGYFKLIAVF